MVTQDETIDWNQYQRHRFGGICDEGPVVVERAEGGFDGLDEHEGEEEAENKEEEYDTDSEDEKIFLFEVIS